jgi:Rad3-related DNA helicase
MRSVNQGIGRVIRHINDYGMILMLDNRYDQNKLKSMLPAWAK